MLGLDWAQAPEVLCAHEGATVVYRFVVMMLTLQGRLARGHRGQIYQIYIHHHHHPALGDAMEHA